MEKYRKMVSFLLVLLLTTINAEIVEVTLQQGNNGYTGCEDMCLLNNGYANNKNSWAFEGHVDPDSEGYIVNMWQC